MERLTQLRSRIVQLLFVAILCFFAFRLYDLQIIETGGVIDNTTTYTTWTRVKAARGEILDRNGNVLVGNRASYDLVMNHFVLTSSATPNQSIYELVKLCQELDIEYTDHFPITTERPFTYTLDQYNASWQGYFQKFLANRGDLDSDISAPLLIDMLRKSYQIPDEWSDEDARLVLGIRYELTLRNLTTLSNYVFISDASEEDLAVILELNTPGMNVEASTVREYYTHYAAHILGYVGAMDAKQWVTYKELGYSMDAVVGQAGFELAFEDYLHATDGVRVDEVAADGTVIRSYYRQEPIAGNNVEVTIDIELQMVAEQALEAQVLALRSSGDSDGHDAQGASVVVMEPSSGEVLVCASYPTYDPATLRENFAQIVQEDYDPLYNRALQGEYPPGSTYKMTMVVAGINAGRITSKDKILDEGVYDEYEDFAPECLRYSSGFGTHGEINASESLCVSCNYFYYVLGDALSANTVDKTAKALGLGEPTGIELPEATGHRVNEETKKLLYTGSNQKLTAGDRILGAIGQSDNKFTPMQLCVYTSTLANKGVRMRATFLNQVVSSDYRNRLYVNEPEIVSTLTVSEDCFLAYNKGMQMVASYYTPQIYGTAIGTFRHYPISVACKTGTAQHGITTASDHGAFVCYAPADSQPKIAIAIYGERAGYGSSMAVVAKEILDAFFAVGDLSEVPTYENQAS